MRTLSFRVGAVALVLTAAVFTGPADDPQRHFQAIGCGRVEDVMAGYAD